MMGIVLDTGQVVGHSIVAQPYIIGAIFELDMNIHFAIIVGAIHLR